WKISKSFTHVHVGRGNGEVPLGSLSIPGYDVSGTVTSDSQAITGVSFVLFSKLNQSVNIVGCHKDPLPGFSGAGIEGLKEAVPLCHVTSDLLGKFVFPQVPPGDYILVPYYTTGTGRSTKFDVHPRVLHFSVGHGSLKLSTPFQVKGFTVSGKVLWSTGGKPIADASVLIDGRIVAKTGPDGVYHLESMRAGNYKLKIEAPGVEFTVSDVKVTATTLPDMVPTKYRLCGKLMPPIEGVKVALVQTTNGVDSTPVISTTDSRGSYCVFLNKGSYKVSVQLIESLKRKGLQFSPALRTVEVSDSTVDNVDFSQLKCTVKGKIECLSSVCPLITVNLKPKIQGPTLQTIAKGGVYEFKEVIPGEYDVFIEPGLGWCWAKESQSLNVISEITEAPTFAQSGFTVTIISSHTTKVVYYQPSKPNVRNDLIVSPGSTHVCVPSSGPYIFEPEGCHGYKDKKIHWVTGPVTLTAVTHANTIAIQTTHAVDDLVVNVVPSEESGSSPVKMVPKLKKSPDQLRYELTLQLAEGEKVTLVPSASLLLFSPLTTELRGGSDCVNFAEPLFNAEKGHVVSGKVTTGSKNGLGDVLISVVDQHGSVISTQQTSPDGTYKFSPLRIMTNYKVIAEKEGYILTALSREGDFSAHKLAEIVVSVKDKADSQPLQSVLLSLSGGESYRRNAQTNVNGTMSFLSLSPGEYFLRPMMKEYRFIPANKIIEVKEGATVEVELRGERVAFSGFGQVTSLNGEGESGVVVEAIGVGNCSILQEEATSGPTGHFRIRGLQPYCEYNVQVKQALEINQHIQQNSSPDLISIKVSSADVEGLRLYALRPIIRTDITVYVVPDHPEDLKTLRVKLCREEAPDTAVYVVKLSDYKPTAGGYALSTVILTLPPVPADGRGYIVKLESSLSQSTHAYTLRPVHFKADSPLRLVRLGFSPRAKASEPELSQPSYLAVPLIVLALLSYYHRNSLSTFAAVIMQARIGAPVPRNGVGGASDDSGSETFLDPVPKRKTKSRKT
ncbi:hypothetical protein AAG570_003595, partial [Ranatra chinensis]